MSGSASSCAGNVHGVLVTYQRPGALAETLDLVTAPGSGLASLVVVDNGDSRVGQTLVAQTTAAIPTDYVAMAENAGPAGGVAAGAARVVERADDHDWLLVLDDDNPPQERGAIQQLHAFAASLAARGTNVGAVGIAGARFNRWTGTLHTPSDRELTGAIAVDYVAGNQLLLASVGAVRRCGAHDPDLFFGFEELDFCLRLEASGFGVYVDGDALSRARTRKRRTSGRGREAKASVWRRYYGVRNLIVIMRRFGRPGSAALVTLVQVLGRPLIDLVRGRAPLRGYVTAGFRGAVDAWRGRLGRVVDPVDAKARTTRSTGAVARRPGRWIIQQVRRARYVVLGAELVVIARVGGAQASGGEQPSYRKVFVVGCPRSGTTWVQQILQHHPSVVGTEESYALRRVNNAVRDSRYDVFGWARLLYGFDRDVRLGRHVGLHNYLSRRELRAYAIQAIRSGTTDQDVVNRLIDSIFDHYFLHHRKDASEVLVEKTPFHLWYARDLLLRYPDALIVEVLRDGRDVCASMRVLARSEDWLRPTLEAQIRDWVAFAEAGRQLRADVELSGRVHLVRYERLKAQPEREIKRLFEFAGISAGAELVRSVAEATDFANLDDTGEHSHARKGQVGDWINHFTTEDERLFREIAGPTFAKVGYRF